MGYRGNERGGGDRWNERDYRGDGERGYRDQGRGGYERGGGYGQRGWDEGGRGYGSHDRDEDRGFFERASENVRSWFGGNDSDDGRERWSRDREHRMSERRDNGYGGGAGTLGGGGFGSGWGNQAGESWNSERPGRSGWFTDSVGGERGRRPGAGYDDPAGGRGGYDERMQGPAAGGGMGGGSPRYTPMTGDYGRGGGVHDPHYSEWRRRQVEELDRDYDEYRREHQSRFEQEFGSWRSKRQGQRQLLGRVTEHMEVLGSDGSHIGKVDKVRGDRIILAKNDPNSGGIHHSVPCSWVDNVDERVTLNRTAEQAVAEWKAEEQNRALFERPDQGSEGPHVLNRSFSGTYRERDD